MNVFITGNNRGLGKGLADHYLEQGAQLFGLSRSGWPGSMDGVREVACDLADADAIPDALDALFAGVSRLDLVVLNAGVLGEIRDLSDTPLEDVKRVMDINLWANKVILDWLRHSDMIIGQIVLMSSGAAVNGNRGWNGYALSKAALNMMTQLYAHEFPDTHIAAFAPGLVDTEMQDHLCDEVDSGKFTSIASLKAARGTPAMPKPGEAAGVFAEAFARLQAYPSGSFVDIRQM